MNLNDFKNELIAEHITLKRFKPADIPELRKIAEEEDIWSFYQAQDQSIDDFLDTYFIEQTKGAANGTQVGYVVVQNRDNKIIGSTRFYDIAFLDKKIAIGFTWYHPSVWGSKVNPEAKLLLLKFAFEELEFNRVEFHIDTRNQRSINAVNKLGAKQEGILRQHKIVQGNFVRDTVICSIITSEWPEVKKRLLSRL